MIMHTPAFMYPIYLRHLHLLFFSLQAVLICLRAHIQKIWPNNLVKTTLIYRKSLAFLSLLFLLCAVCMDLGVEGLTFCSVKCNCLDIPKSPGHSNTQPFMSQLSSQQFHIRLFWKESSEIICSHSFICRWKAGLKGKKEIKKLAPNGWLTCSQVDGTQVSCSLA